MINNTLLKKIIYLFFAILLTCGCNGKQKQSSNNNNKVLLFIGTYTEDEGWVKGMAKGIYVYEFDTVSGELTYSNTSVKIKNPSFVAVHPNKEFLYAVSETGGDAKNQYASVYAFKIDKDAKSLSLIDSVPSMGKSPCYVSFDKTGKFALVSNYGSGTVAMFPIASDGQIKEAISTDQHVGKGPTSRQEGPHAHMIMPSTDNRFAYSVDLGVDQVIQYQLDIANGKLIPTNHNTIVKAGSGPRQITFHPNNKWAYLVNELNGTVDVFDVNITTGSLTPIQSISTFENGKPEDAGSGDIRVSPDGKYVYASNRGSMNNLAMYEVDSNSGKLKVIGYHSSEGKAPRFFTFDPSGKFLLVANQNSSNVVVFKMDKLTGKIIGDGKSFEIPTPVCLKFLQ